MSMFAESIFMFMDRYRRALDLLRCCSSSLVVSNNEDLIDEIEDLLSEVDHSI